MKKKVDIHNNKLDGFKEIEIIGDIGGYDAWSISNFFKNCETKKARIKINSYGGNVIDAFAIITEMQNFMNAGGVIETVNMGRADSCAGWIFSCGTRGMRNVMQFAGGFVHPPEYEDGGTIETLPDGAEKDALIDYFDRLVNIYVACTGRTASAIKTLMQNKTDMKAKEMVKQGFADTEIEVDNMPKLKNGLKPAEIVNALSAFDYKIKNKVPDSGKKPNTNNMKEVAKMLNLNPEASASSIEGEIALVIKNRDQLKNEAVAKDKKILDLTTERDALVLAKADLEDKEIIDFVESLKIKDAGEKAEALQLAKVNLAAFKRLNTVKNKTADSIDKGLKPTETETEGDDLKRAKEFKNMSRDEKEALKKSDYNKYIGLANSYDLKGGEIV